MSFRRWVAAGAISLAASAAVAQAPQPKPRGRELGIPFSGKAGPLNAITDVPGVAVGHVTLISGEGRLVPGQGPVHTGVTAILTRPKGDWDFDVSATHYAFDHDRQQTPATASATDTSFGTAGRVAVLDGTGWSTLDLKGIWRQGGVSGSHVLTFGVHGDRYALANATYNSPDWREGDVTTVATDETPTGGATMTSAVSGSRLPIDPVSSARIGPSTGVAPAVMSSSVS